MTLAEIFFGFPGRESPAWPVIGAILCIVIIVWGLNQSTRDDCCKGCKYDHNGRCKCDFLCEDGDMWEAKNQK